MNSTPAVSNARRVTSVAGAADSFQPRVDARSRYRHAPAARALAGSNQASRAALHCIGGPGAHWVRIGDFGASPPDRVECSIVRPAIRTTLTGSALARTRRALPGWVDVPAPIDSVRAEASPAKIYILRCLIEQVRTERPELYFKTLVRLTEALHRALATVIRLVPHEQCTSNPIVSHEFV